MQNPQTATEGYRLTSVHCFQICVTGFGYCRMVKRAKRGESNWLVPSTVICAGETSFLRRSSIGLYASSSAESCISRFTGCPKQSAQSAMAQITDRPRPIGFADTTCNHMPTSMSGGLDGACSYRTIRPAIATGRYPSLASAFARGA